MRCSHQADLAVVSPIVCISGSVHPLLKVSALHPQGRQTLAVAIAAFSTKCATGLSMLARDQLLDSCNHVLRIPGGLRFPCKARRPNQRYFQLNLVPLHRFGTIEFRAHSASYDLERIGRWSQFLVAFVEHFGAGKGAQRMEKYFSWWSNADKDYEKLRQAQRAATAAELFDELEGLIDPGSKNFYLNRVWEQNDKTCLPNVDPLTEIPKCAQESQWFSLAELVSERGTERTMRAPVPLGHSPGSYVQVEMPEGDIRAHRVNTTAIESGFFHFSYDPQMEAQRNMQRRGV